MSGVTASATWLQGCGSEHLRGFPEVILKLHSKDEGPEDQLLEELGAEPGVLMLCSFRGQESLAASMAAVPSTLGSCCTSLESVSLIVIAIRVFGLVAERQLFFCTAISMRLPHHVTSRCFRGGRWHWAPVSTVF